MTPYFSRLAQRSGAPAPAGRGGRARAADAGATPAATTHADAGYREQEQSIDVDAAPSVPTHAPRFGEDAPAVGETRANVASSPVDALAPRAQSAHPMQDPHGDTGRVGTQGEQMLSVDASAIEAYRIDPYRNGPDEDDIGEDFAARTIVRTVSSPGLLSSGFESPLRARSDAEALGDGDADPARGMQARDDGEVHRQVEAATQGHARVAARGSVRAVSVQATGEMSPHLRAGDAATDDEDVRASAHAHPSERASEWARPTRESANRVRAQAPQASVALQAPAARGAQNLHVQIGRIELEVIAPAPKAPPAPPPPAPAAPAASPARKSAFNPHRHYLRGR